MLLVRAMEDGNEHIPELRVDPNEHPAFDYVELTPYEHRGTIVSLLLINIALNLTCIPRSWL